MIKHIHVIIGACLLALLWLVVVYIIGVVTSESLGARGVTFVVATALVGYGMLRFLEFDIVVLSSALRGHDRLLNFYMTTETYEVWHDLRKEASLRTNTALLQRLLSFYMFHSQLLNEGYVLARVKDDTVETMNIRFGKNTLDITVERRE